MSSLSALKDGGVNLLAYLGFPLGGGQSQIDLVPEDPESLKDAAERTGVTLSEPKRAFLIQGDDRLGAVADTTARLAAANINITAAAATGAGAGRYGMILWVAPRSQMQRLLYLDHNYLSRIMKRKPAFGELEPVLRKSSRAAPSASPSRRRIGSSRPSGRTCRCSRCCASSPPASGSPTSATGRVLLRAASRGNSRTRLP